MGRKHMNHKKFMHQLATGLLMATLIFSMPQVSFAEATGEAVTATFENLMEKGKDQIVMTQARSFKAVLPVEMTEEEANRVKDSIEWTLTRTQPYLDTGLFPHYYKGTALADWKDNQGENWFSHIQTGVEKIEGQVCLTVSFEAGLYYEDGSMPHGTANQTMDYIGLFDLAAMNGETALASTQILIAPYDDFNTMDQLYEQLHEMAAYDTHRYVEEFSMGQSGKGYNMPYLIVADSRESVDKWLAFTELAEKDPDTALSKLEAGAYEDLRVPVMFSNVHANESAAPDGVLKFAWHLVQDKALDYDVLTGFTEEGQKALAEEQGPKGEAGSLAVPDLIADDATYLGYLKAGNEHSGTVDLEKYYTVENKEVAIDALLEDVFFILVPEENVEGRMQMTRTPDSGYDLNRDNSFQTTQETMNMQKLIGTYNPVSLTEFHGRVRDFQCEPCDPPHEPNFEYDLLSEHLLKGGEALGIAAVANNTSYNSYVIPQRDYLEYTGKGNETYWADPWDDMSTSYTPQFAMLQGTCAYTVELPAYNDEAVACVTYGALGQSAYVGQEKLAYLKAQTKIYQRGVQNMNSNAYEMVGQWLCDQYDVEGADSKNFRPEYTEEGQNGNFYPECYIIPLDATNQSNLSAANDMMTWLSRNDVKIRLTDKAFTYQGVSYPAGTMIVSMYQAKRSVANGALYDGTLINNWTILYSEGITCFNETRGFDMITVAEPDAYKTIEAACGEPMDSEACMAYLKKVGSSFVGPQSEQVILSNVSEEATAAVNEMLQQGKKVGMITDANSGYYGDFICAYEDWEAISSRYRLTGTGIAEVPAAKVITRAPLVYIAGASKDTDKGFIGAARVSNYNWNYDRCAATLMNLQQTDEISKATFIMGASKLNEEELQAVKKGKPYIGYGRSINGSALFEEGALTRAKVEGAMDCLGYVTYPETTLVNASYVMDQDDILYGYGVGYFETIPEGAKVLVRMDGSKQAKEGFIPTITDKQKEQATLFYNDSIQAISYQEDEMNVVLFANTLTHKVHQRDEYAFISNFAFETLLGEDYK